MIAMSDHLVLLPTYTHMKEVDEYISPLWEHRVSFSPPLFLGQGFCFLPGKVDCLT